jgi:hypothetical protein
MDHSNIYVQDNTVPLITFPDAMVAPVFPVLAQGASAELSDLLEARSRLVPVLKENRLLRSKLEGQLVLVQGDPASIRTLDGNTPSSDTIRNYIHNTRAHTHTVGENVNYQEYIMKFLNTLIQQKMSGPTHLEDLDPQQSKADKTGTASIDDMMAITPVPSAVTRFGKTGSPNAKEFLRTFFTEIEALSTCYDPDDGGTMGRYLLQVIDDADLKNAFAKDFVARMNDKKPDVLTMDEVSNIFIQHCDNIEAFKRLFSMTPKPKESLADYNERALDDIQLLGRADYCPDVVEYLESNLPPVARSLVRILYLVNHLYRVGGHAKPRIPLESFNGLYNAGLQLVGNMDDYGLVPSGSEGPFVQTSEKPNYHRWNTNGNGRREGLKRARRDTTPDSSAHEETQGSQ